eukprot:9396164-Lingulodinium_polyedra.AAC.1
MRRVARFLAPGAAPGASSWRNPDISEIARTKGGVEALAAWLRGWAEGGLSAASARVWTAALIVPLDVGPKKPT